jgi:hypothetical protein
MSVEVILQNTVVLSNKYTIQVRGVINGHLVTSIKRTKIIKKNIKKYKEVERTPPRTKN